MTLPFEEYNETISGHVYEEGSGKPIAGVDVFLMAEGNGAFPETEQMAQTITDHNGAFVIDNTRHPAYDRHYLTAQGFVHYNLNNTTDKTKFAASRSTKSVDIHLYRRAILKVHLVNTGNGTQIQVLSNRETITWKNILVADTTFNLAVEGFVPNKITNFPVTNGVQTRRDTILYIEPNDNKILELHY